MLRDSARSRGYSETAAGDSGATRFILFHDKRHPRELTVADVGGFLSTSHEAAVQATRGLGLEVPAPVSAGPGGSPVRPCSNLVRTADWV
ncbi:MAG TPA: hypothetical protein VKI65_05955 [Gemmataceae bacterium]|nr:hypothetical protein [Gemmataceae bacterium]